MKAKVISLVICHSCHKRVTDKKPYTIWEKSVYCDPCFEEYMDAIEPVDFINNENR